MPDQRPPEPELVQRAAAWAAASGFSKSCIYETGRLLQLLARSVTCGVIGELGSGYGYGTAWLASGRRAGVRLVTVECDARAAAATREVLAGLPDVTVLEDD